MYQVLPHEWICIDDLSYFWQIIIFECGLCDIIGWSAKLGWEKAATGGYGEADMEREEKEINGRERGLVWYEESRWGSKGWHWNNYTLTVGPIS